MLKKRTYVYMCCIGGMHDYSLPRSYKFTTNRLPVLSFQVFRPFA